MQYRSTSSIVALMDAHLWNDQTEVVDHLFPDAEAIYPDAHRWYELKDTSPSALDRLECEGAPVLRWRTHAWLGLPSDAEVIGAHLRRLGMR